MKEKIIKDLVFGFIHIDDGVAEVIDHRSFQRLKNISQLTAHHLFPSANHTRFEHSLGVMQLAVRFIEALKCKIIELAGKEHYEKCYIHLKYAALLHDVGHAPLSHVGEAFFDKNNIKENIKALLGHDRDNSYCNESASAHELMSCYVILKNFKSLLERIFNSNNTPLDIEYILRMITGSCYSDSSMWLYNMTIELLNSKSIDVDKLDYLMRDNFMTGEVAPKINLDRLLFSITIDGMKKIAYTPTGISSVVSIIDCRDFLYLWVYNHHVVVYTDYLYKEIIKHLISERNTISKQKLSYPEYFSCKAIADYYITDDDIRTVINKEAIDTDSQYSKLVLSQLLERKFLKPLWKTIFEFNSFMSKSFLDSRQRHRIIDIVTSDKAYEKLGELVNKILYECHLQSGQLFIIPRSNKFYAMSRETEFYIETKRYGDVDLKDIMPERRFDEKYSNIVFYVFAPTERLNEVEQALVSILKRDYML